VLKTFFKDINYAQKEYSVKISKCSIYKILCIHNISLVTMCKSGESFHS